MNSAPMRHRFEQQSSFYSHQGQDRWVIERVFPGKRDGWFIDAGAGPDGIKGSNTYALETLLGWKGLLVEPHPACFPRVRQNRRVAVEQACLTDRAGDLEFFLHDMPELSTTAQDLSEPNAEAANYGRKDYQKVTVPGVPLWELLRRHNAPPVIEFMSLDVEGNEWVALENFPFHEFRILAMSIERGAKSYARLKAKLLGEGYRLAHVAGPDDFYVHSSVVYETTVAERIDTWRRGLWNTLYFQEPLLTLRRVARAVRRFARPEFDGTAEFRPKP